MYMLLILSIKVSCRLYFLRKLDCIDMVQCGAVFVRYSKPTVPELDVLGDFDMLPGLWVCRNAYFGFLCDSKPEYEAGWHFCFSKWLQEYMADGECKGKSSYHLMWFMFSFLRWSWYLPWKTNSAKVVFNQQSVKRHKSVSWNIFTRQAAFIWTAFSWLDSTKISFCTLIVFLRKNSPIAAVLLFTFTMFLLRLHYT